MSQAEQNCCWHFAQSLGGLDQGPNDAMGENFKKDPYESLVREAIQNSIDAQADPNVPVIVTFSFKKTTSRNYPNLFEIRRHIRGCLDLYDDDSSEKKFRPMLNYLRDAETDSMDYLEVSDENTTGMPYKKGDTKSPFYSFVQSAGNSSKSSTSAGGSFGFGKAAYFNVSKIRTLLISTMTNEGKRYFQGVASLCTHKIGHEKRVPVGYYGNYINLPEPVDEVPIQNPDDIPIRFRRQAQGTSMFIMGLDLNRQQTLGAMRSINEAVVKHFWLAIIMNKLIVRVMYGDQVHEINPINLTEYAERIFDEYDDARRGHKNPRPYIDAVVNAGHDDKHLVFEKQIPHLGHCSFYLIKSKKGNDYILNMRSTFMLIKHDSNHTDYGFYSVFVCTDKDGNEILRNAENPAHNEWDSRNASQQDRNLVRVALKAKDVFIQECIKSVFVSSDVDELDFGGLDEYLSIPMSLDDDDYNPDLGKPTDVTTPEETTSANTEINEEPSTTPLHAQNLGEVVVKKPKSPKRKDDDGNKEPTGHTPETKPQKPKPGDDEDDTDNNKPDKPEKEDEDKPKGSDANDNPDNVVPEDEGKRLPDREPLRISYRTFAQNGADGLEHRLVIHSNRASNNVVITLISGGETSDEPLAVRKSDNGNIINNKLTHVRLNEEKTIIRVWFADDMRHAIKLNAYEN